MRLAISFCLLLACGSATSRADMFGSGANTFEIEFVTVGDPGNPYDPQNLPYMSYGAADQIGGVDYSYRIGKYEISEDMVNKANAEGGLNITHDNRGTEKPVTNVSWLGAASFVNWLNTSSGFHPAYKFNGGEFKAWEPTDQGYDPDNVFRNRMANYFLPSADEWHKAAYYDPTTGSYYRYPTGSDTRPGRVESNTLPNTAVYDLSSFHEPAEITQAGGLSSYGTMAQGGNVAEWEETEVLLGPGPGSLVSLRGIRGGGFIDNSVALTSGSRFVDNAAYSQIHIGFRVASRIPEPSTLLLGALAGLGLLLHKRSR